MQEQVFGMASHGCLQVLVLVPCGIYAGANVRGGRSDLICTTDLPCGDVHLLGAGLGTSLRRTLNPRPPNPPHDEGVELLAAESLSKGTLCAQGPFTQTLNRQEAYNLIMRPCWVCVSGAVEDHSDATTTVGIRGVLARPHINECSHALPKQEAAQC